MKIISSWVWPCNNVLMSKILGKTTLMSYLSALHGIKGGKAQSKFKNNEYVISNSNTIIYPSLNILYIPFIFLTKHAMSSFEI